MHLREPIYSRAHQIIDMEALAEQGISSEPKIADWIAQHLPATE